MSHVWRDFGSLLHSQHWVLVSFKCHLHAAPSLTCRPSLPLLALQLECSFARLQEWLAPAFLCNRVQQRMIQLAIVFMCYIVVMGCTVMTLERAGNLDSFGTLTGASSVGTTAMTVWNSFYWAVITTTTVGYGESRHTKSSHPPCPLLGRLLPQLDGLGAATLSLPLSSHLRPPSFLSISLSPLICR